MKYFLIVVFILLLTFPIFSQSKDVYKTITIVKSGLYKLDHNYKLELVFDNSTAYCYKCGVFYVFNFFTKGGHLFYHPQSNTVKELSLRSINKVHVKSTSEIIIDGTVSKYIRGQADAYESKSISISLDRFNVFEIEIGATYEYEECGSLIHFSDTFRAYIGGDLDGKIDDDYYLFKLFGNYIVLDLSNILPAYSYSNLVLYYIPTLNEYFISVNNWGRLE